MSTVTKAGDGSLYIAVSGGLGASNPWRTWACNPRFPGAKMVLDQARQSPILLLKNILLASLRFALTGGLLVPSQTLVEMTAEVRE